MYVLLSFVVVWTGNGVRTQRSRYGVGGRNGAVRQPRNGGGLTPEDGCCLFPRDAGRIGEHEISEAFFGGGGGGGNMPHYVVGSRVWFR